MFERDRVKEREVGGGRGREREEEREIILYHRNLVGTSTKSFYYCVESNR